MSGRYPLLVVMILSGIGSSWAQHPESQDPTCQQTGSPYHFGDQPNIENSIAVDLTREEDLIEELLYRDEDAELPIQILEEHLNRMEKRLDLNAASRDELNKCGLFTPYQIHTLLEYRDRYGPFFSIYELASVKGFRIAQLKQISASITARQAAATRRPAHSSHMVMINTGRSYPEAEGYRSLGNAGEEPPYTGSPVKFSLRIKSKFGNGFSLGAAFQKDAGEQGFDGIRPEFFSGYLCYRGDRMIRKVVAGTFRLNQGLGLVNGSGMMIQPGNLQINRLSISRLTPYASVSETGYSRGAAVQLDLKRFHLQLWSSHRYLDLSTGKLSKLLDVTDIMLNSHSSGNELRYKGLDLKEYRRESGLHRTEGELEGRSLGSCFQTGIHSAIWFRNLTAGCLAGIERSFLTRRAVNILGIDPPPSFYTYFSLFWQWQRNGFETFGEFATRNISSTALLTGIRHLFGDFLHTTILLHRYTPAYRGMDPASYASGSHVENENGISLHLHCEPVKWLVADCCMEYFKYPQPRYLTSVPSSGARITSTFQGTGIGELHWRIRLVKRIWQSTPVTNAAVIPGVVTTDRTRADLRLGYKNRVFSWQSRLVLSSLSEEGSPAEQESHVPACAAVQRITVGSSENKIRWSFQFVAFNAGHWDNRIYLHEPGPLYQFSFPVHYGHGTRVSWMITTKPFSALTLSGKISVVNYSDRKNTGSGHEMRKGNRKWEGMIQLRMKI